MILKASNPTVPKNRHHKGTFSVFISYTLNNPEKMRMKPKMIKKDKLIKILLIIPLNLKIPIAK